MNISYQFFRLFSNFSSSFNIAAKVSVLCPLFSLAIPLVSCGGEQKPLRAHLWWESWMYLLITTIFKLKCLFSTCFTTEICGRKVYDDEYCVHMALLAFSTLFSGYYWLFSIMSCIYSLFSTSFPFVFFVIGICLYWNNEVIVVLSLFSNFPYFPLVFSPWFCYLSAEVLGEKRNKKWWWVCNKNTQKYSREWFGSTCFQSQNFWEIQHY